MRRIAEFVENSWRYIALLALMLLVMLCCGGCTTTEYVPVESSRTDSIYISKLKWDSVYVQDSVFIHERGETIFVDKVRYKYVEHYSHDTVYSEKIDSVRVPYPMERKLTKWENRWMVAGKVALSTVAVLMFIVVGWVMYRIWR